MTPGLSGGRYQYANTEFGISLKQPYALRDGFIEIEQPQLISESTIEFAPRRYDLSLPVKEHHYTAQVVHHLLPTTKVAVALTQISNQGHFHDRDGQSLQINFSHKF